MLVNTNVTSTRGSKKKKRKKMKERKKGGRGECIIEVFLLIF